MAVVQSDAGALVIPPASFSQRGGVRLGTERLISGSGVLPVGETTARQRGRHHGLHPRSGGRF